MRRSVWATLALAGASGIASASLTQIATRAQFNAAYPNAVLEDFEEARVDAGVAAGMTGPLNAATNNELFLPGDIVGGLQIDIPGTLNMLICAAGFANYTSDTVSFNVPNTASPQIAISFLGGQRAIAFDVTSNPDFGSVRLDVFSGASLLGSFSVVGVGSGTFFGVSSDSDLITHVNMTGLPFFGVDNIAFTPAPAGAALLVGGLLCGSRRRR